MRKKRKRGTQSLSNPDRSHIKTNIKLELQEAVLLHQSGQLKQAATIYQQVLDIEPENANAWHLLGLVSHQSGQSETAITLIKQALNISPNQLNYLHNLANIL